MKSHITYYLRKLPRYARVYLYNFRALSTLEHRRGNFAVLPFVSERKKIRPRSRPVVEQEDLVELLARREVKQKKDELDMHIKTAKLLLDCQKYPCGSFACRQYVLARETLDYLREICSPDIILTCLRLLERLIQNQKLRPVQSQLIWFCLPRYWNKILINWLKALPENPNFLSSQELSARLKLLPEQQSAFRYNNETIRILVEGTLLHLPKAEAPLAIEHLLQTWKTDSSPYVLLFDAWLNSGLDVALQKIDDFAEYVMAQGVAPCPILFDRIVKYWAEQRAIEQVEKAISVMEKYHVQLYPSTLSYVVLGYTNVSDMNGAEHWLERMIESRQSYDKRSKQYLFKAILYILNSYRSIIYSQQSSLQAKAEALSSAQGLVKMLQNKSTILQAKFYETEVFGRLLTMFAEIGYHEQVEAMLEKHHHDPEMLSKVMCLYKNKKLAEQADQLLKTVLSKPSFEPKGVHIFNVVLSAWAESSDQNSFARAFDVIRYIIEDPTCKRHDIQPDLNSFNYLLKCLVNNAESTKNVGEMVGWIWNALSSFTLYPNQESYRLAIKAFLLADDYDQASFFLNNMEQGEGFSPCIETYVSLLFFFAKHASQRNAERAEQMLCRLRNHAATRTLLPGNLNTICKNKRELESREHLPAICYSLVMSCWAQSETPDKVDRLLKIHEQMKADDVPLDKFAYSELINALTTSSSVKMIEQASSLLREMASNSELRPWGPLYARVISGWFGLGHLDRARETMHLLKHSLVSRPTTENRFRKFFLEMFQVAFQRDISTSAFPTFFMQEILNLVDNLGLHRDFNVEILKCLRETWFSSGLDGSDPCLKDLSARIAKVENNVS